jgi:hypothetical protein
MNPNESIEPATNLLPTLSNEKRSAKVLLAGPDHHNLPHLPNEKRTASGLIVTGDTPTPDQKIPDLTHHMAHPVEDPYITQKKINATRVMIVGFELRPKDLQTGLDELMALHVYFKNVLDSPLGDIADVYGEPDRFTNRLAIDLALANTVTDELKKEFRIHDISVIKKTLTFTTLDGFGFGWEQTKKGNWIFFVEAWQGIAFTPMNEIKLACEAKGWLPLVEVVKHGTGPNMPRRIQKSLELTKPQLVDVKAQQRAAEKQRQEENREKARKAMEAIQAAADKRAAEAENKH